MYKFFIYVQGVKKKLEEKKAFCMLECARSQSNNTAVCVCEGVLWTVANSNANMDMAKKCKEEGCLCRRKASG